MRPGTQLALARDLRLRPFGLSARLRRDLSSMRPSGCRLAFGETSAPCALRAVGSPSARPQLHAPFGLSARLRRDLSSMRPSGCRLAFGDTSAPNPDRVRELGD